MRVAMKRCYISVSQFLQTYGRGFWKWIYLIRLVGLVVVNKEAVFAFLVLLPILEPCIELDFIGAIYFDVCLISE
jgi:hypothetical protein